MIQLVVCDLETALLSDHCNTISEDVFHLISELKAQDILFAVVSGYNYDTIYPLFGDLKNDIIYICSDGGSIIYRDQVISKSAIDRLICLDIEKEMSEKKEYNISYATERGLFVTTKKYDFLKTFQAVDTRPEYIEDVKKLHGDITKITIYSKDGFDEAGYGYYYNKWSRGANVLISTENQMDITALYVDKAGALSFVQQAFDISKEDTVVFGGGYSDIGMFERSYFSYAMQTSDAEVKRAAQYIAENVETIIEDILRMR